jgi:hypothetical protein
VWPGDPGPVFESPLGPPLETDPTTGQAQDWRLPNLLQFNNFPIYLGNAAPVLQANFYRGFLLVQNNDGAATLLIGFGSQAQANSALYLGPGIGFVWDSAVPFSSMYVTSNGAVATNNIYSGIEGTFVSPSQIPNLTG